MSPNPPEVPVHPLPRHLQVISEVLPGQYLAMIKDQKLQENPKVDVNKVQLEPRDLADIDVLRSNIMLFNRVHENIENVASQINSKLGEKFAQDTKERFAEVDELLKRLINVDTREPQLSEEIFAGAKHFTWEGTNPGKNKKRYWPSIISHLVSNTLNVVLYIGYK